MFFAQARGRLPSAMAGTSRFGEIPKPTVESGYEMSVQQPRLWLFAAFAPPFIFAVERQ